MYEVQNPNTQHIFFKTNDLNLAKKYYECLIKLEKELT